MKHLLKICCLLGLFFISSCDLTDLDANLENPNEVGVSSLDVDLVMNKIQLDFADFITEVNIPSMELSRMVALTGGDIYARAYQAQSFDAIWIRAYQRVLIQIETLLKSTDGTGRTVHSGSARVLKAYVLLTLVDMFGDVPYSEALKGLEGSAKFNPKADSGKAIYDEAIKLLDEALVLLGRAATTGLRRDIYYGGNATRWAALANTLKLKAYMNLRLTDKAGATAKIRELLGKDLIDTDAEEFIYRFSSADVPVRSRHPLYRDMYQPQSGSAANYIGNYYMLSAYKQKGVEDPRWRYYFYRQVGSIDKALDDDPESIPCTISPRPSHYGRDQAWCSFDPGFFGRDHGNSDGVPPDTRAKTCVGSYPSAGLTDVNVSDATFQVVTQQGQGGNGAGIHPIWMASFTDFVKAEAALMLGTEGNAEALMISGVEKSIARTRAFANSISQPLPAGLEPSTPEYVNAVKALYTKATTDDQKLDVVMKEYYLALWCNGIEAYNMYRRTGKPGDMQPMRAATPGNFLRSFYYPSELVNLNSAVPQKSFTAVTKVFWDNNPDNFIK